MPLVSAEAPVAADERGGASIGRGLLRLALLVAAALVMWCFAGSGGAAPARRQMSEWLGAS